MAWKQVPEGQSKVENGFQNKLLSVKFTSTLTSVMTTIQCITEMGCDWWSVFCSNRLSIVYPFNLIGPEQNSLSSLSSTNFTTLKQTLPLNKTKFPIHYKKAVSTSTIYSQTFDRISFHFNDAIFLQNQTNNHNESDNTLLHPPDFLNRIERARVTS